jgi:hypothetical protein
LRTPDGTACLSSFDVRCDGCRDSFAGCHAGIRKLHVWRRHGAREFRERAQRLGERECLLRKAMLFAGCNEKALLLPRFKISIIARLRL